MRRTGAPLDVKMERVPYAEVEGRTLDLLVWRPASGGPRPGVLDLHGGVWTFYAPELDFYLCQALASRGMVTAAVDFRLAPRHPWPTPLEDVRAAARFFRHHAVRFDVDPRLGIGVIGGSSGGHLAAMLAILPNGAATASSDTPAGARVQVDWAAPVWPILDPLARFRMAQDGRFGPITTMTRRALARLERTPRDPQGRNSIAWLQRLHALRSRLPATGDVLGRVVQDARALFFESAIGRAILFEKLVRAQRSVFAGPDQMEAASPVVVLRRDEQQATPPMLVIHGLRDTNMTREMTEGFVAAYRARGGCVTVKYPRRYGHAFGNIPSRAADTLAEKIAAFARQAMVAG